MTSYVSRAATLYGVPRDETKAGHAKTFSELKRIFAALIKQSKTPEASCAPDIPPHDPEGYIEGEAAFPGNDESTTPLPDTLVQLTQKMADTPSDAPEQRNNSPSHLPRDEITTPKLDMPTEDGQPIERTLLVTTEVSRKADTYISSHQEMEPVLGPVRDNLVSGEAARQPDTVSNSREIKKPKLKIKVKQSGASSRAEDHDKATRVSNARNNGDGGASSWVSVDAPHKNVAETTSTGNHNNLEDANSWQDVGSRVTASIGSAKPTVDDVLVKELQCTADSSKVSLPLPSDSDHLPTTTTIKIDTAEPQKDKGKKEKKKKDKEKKRKKDDPDRVEHKRRKKEKKRKEKEMAKLLALPPSIPNREEGKASVIIESGQDMVGEKLHNMNNNVGEANVVVNRNDGSSAPSAPSHKIKIKLKNRTFAKS